MCILNLQKNENYLDLLSEFERERENASLPIGGNKRMIHLDGERGEEEHDVRVAFF